MVTHTPRPGKFFDKSGKIVPSGPATNRINSDGSREARVTDAQPQRAPVVGALIRTGLAVQLLLACQAAN